MEPNRTDARNAAGRQVLTSEIAEAYGPETGPGAHDVFYVLQRIREFPETTELLAHRWYP